MRSMRHGPVHTKRLEGFTLISLMITVAIVGILAAIAYPSYIDQVRESRRTEAMSLLMRAANAQEQYYAIRHNGEYTYADALSDLNMPDETKGEWYAVTITGADTDSFTSKATATNDQVNDDCRTFYIDQTGARWANSETRSPTSDISEECW